VCVKQFQPLFLLLLIIQIRALTADYEFTIYLHSDNVTANQQHSVAGTGRQLQLL